MRLRLIAMPLIVVTASLGCTERPNTSDTRSDSSGIWIADHASANSTRAIWEVDSTPRLLIGNSEPGLHAVRGVVQLPDGSIVVANGGTTEIRRYDNTGLLIASTGGRGDGPGEFREITWLARCPGDITTVYDHRRRSFSQFTGDLVLEGVHHLPYLVDRSIRASVSCFADGSIIMSSRRLITGADADVHRDTTTYVRADFGGGTPDTIATVPGADMLIVERRGADFSARQLPFGRIPIAAVGAERFAVSENEAAEWKLISSDGTLIGIIRERDIPTRAVSDEDRIRFREDAMRGVSPDGAPIVAAALEKSRYATAHPPYATALFDRDGFFWVKRAAATASEGMWIVFDPDGTRLGSVSLPAEFTPYDIGHDFILGVMKDPMDVEIVALWGLNRGKR
jgi:hypothetical protein